MNTADSARSAGSMAARWTPVLAVAWVATAGIGYAMGMFNVGTVDKAGAATITAVTGGASLSVLTLCGALLIAVREKAGRLGPMALSMLALAWSAILFGALGGGFGSILGSISVVSALVIAVLLTVAWAELPRRTAPPSRATAT